MMKTTCSDFTIQGYADTHTNAHSLAIRLSTDGKMIHSLPIVVHGSSNKWTVNGSFELYVIRHPVRIAQAFLTLPME